MKITIFLLTIFLVTSAASGQSTEFTYQGKLNEGAIAANANYDFEFRLFDLVAAGTQIGPLVTRTNVLVSSGVFSVQLDFGGFFPGADRFLEVRVRNAGGASYTPLTPRQKINSSPYGIKSLVAETANNANNLGGVAANQFVQTNDTRLSDDRNPLPNSPNYIRNSTTQQTSANLNISGTAIFGSHGDFGGVLSTSSNFFVGGNSTLQGNLTVNGTLTADLPAGDTSYVQNRLSAQAGTNFNISGTGTANILNAGTQFNFNGSRFLSKPGTDNTFAGIGTGPVNTGAANSFFGFNAGNSNTSGLNNAFFGSEAGTANTEGDVNSFFGAAAGKANTLGSENTFVGTSAGFSNTDGNQNTFVGRSAGRLNVNGIRNTFVGFEAGRANTRNDNSFFGHLSGDTNTTGSGNAFFGTGSGGANLDGSRNSFFGTDAGDLNTSGFSNTFVGYAAGNSNTSGNNNTVIGNDADVVGSGRSYATAIGAGATVDASSRIVLGRSNGFDEVIIPASLTIGNLASGGVTSVCYLSGGLLGTCGSSIRYKSNINPFNSGLNLINRLRPVSFNWKDGGMHDLGLGAEEVAAIEPLLVTFSNGQVEGVKYDRIGVVLVNAVKEQQAQIERQQLQIDALTELICTSHASASVCKEKK